MIAQGLRVEFCRDMRAHRAAHCPTRLRTTSRSGAKQHALGIGVRLGLLGLERMRIQHHTIE